MCMSSGVQFAEGASVQWCTNGMNYCNSARKLTSPNTNADWLFCFRFARTDNKLFFSSHNKLFIFCSCGEWPCVAVAPITPWACPSLNALNPAELFRATSIKTFELISAWKFKIVFGFCRRFNYYANSDFFLWFHLDNSLNSHVLVSGLSFVSVVSVFVNFIPFWFCGSFPWFLVFLGLSETSAAVILQKMASSELPCYTLINFPADTDAPTEAQLKADLGLKNAFPCW